RVFLGLRTSWLSREAVILGKYMGMLSAAVGLLWMPVFADYVPEFVKDLIPGWAGSATLAFTIPVGIAGLYSSAMIYIATKRVLWRTPRTLIRFFGTAVVAGLAGTASIASMTGHTSSAVLLGVMAASTLIAKFVWEYRVHFGGNSQDDWDRRSRRIVREHLSVWLHCRVVGFSLGVMLIVLGCVLAFASPVIAGILLGIGALAAVIGDSFERLMYFSSVVYDRMPGTL
ncbi:MAG: molybdopterin oxidoreductase, partial [Planctomycetota bacterium]